MTNVALRYVCGLTAGLLMCTALSLADHHTGFKAELLAQIEQVQKQIMTLEDAVPQEKYTWRPGEGVRSVSEVYSHIAFANYLILKMAGYEPPAEAGWSMDSKKWEGATTDKKAIAKQLTASFANLQSTIKKIPDADLEKEVNLFGTKMSCRAALMTALSHLHEHLGQSIAYARMNGVVPPWTAEQQKQEEAAKAKMK